jgi:hypothetical protein
MSEAALLRKVNIQLRYYAGVDPNTLNDDEWAMTWNDLIWIRKKEAEKNK